MTPERYHVEAGEDMSELQHGQWWSYDRQKRVKHWNMWTSTWIRRREILWKHFKNVMALHDQSLRKL